MFNFETVVVLAVISGLLPRFATAQTLSTVLSCTEPERIERETRTAKRAADRGNDQDKKDDAAADWEAAKANLKICHDNQTKNGGECNTSDEDFRKTMKDFSDACGEAQMGGECLEEVLDCQKTRPRRTVSDGESRDPNKPYDVKGVQKQCPALAGKDIDKLEKEVEKYKEKVQKLEKELPELRDKINTKQSKLNEKQHDLQKDMSDKQKKLTEDLQKLSEDKDAQEKAITDQVTGIAAQIAKAQDALSQVSVTKMEGQLKLKQAKVQADLNCHAQATAQMAKMQNDVLEGIQKGTVNLGGFSKAMSRVGLSDRQHWQRLAQKYYQWCLDSKPTKDTKEGANDGYRLLLTQSRQSEISINKQIEQLKQQQQQLVGGACTGQTQIQGNGTNGGETQICQSVRKSLEKANNLRQAFNEDQNNAKQKYMQIAQEGQQEMQTMQQNYYEKVREIENEKSRLDNAQKYLQAKYDRSGGSSNIDPKGLGKALALIPSLDAAAKTVKSCTLKKNEELGLPAEKCEGKCATAKIVEGKIAASKYNAGNATETAASAPNGSSQTAIDDGDEEFRRAVTTHSSGGGSARE